jgi:hypothetical protein
MAITILSAPQDFTPAYNFVRYQLDSTNKNQNGFRYIVEVFKAGTATKLFEKAYFPAPVTGYGEIDISRDLQDYVSANIPFGLDTFNAENHYLNYDIKFGEEYRVGWLFTDFIFQAGQTAYTQVIPSTTHPFVVGDVIEAKLNTLPGDFRDALQGIYTVTAIPGAYTITTSLPWIGSGVAVSGYVYFADNRKSRFLNLTNLLNQTVLNVALSWNEFNSFLTTDYDLTGGGLFLTSQPKFFSQLFNSDAWIGYYNNNDTTVKRIYFENNLGTIGWKLIDVSSTTTVGLVGVGLNNIGSLTYDVGTNILEAGVEWINFHISDSGGNPLSTGKNYNVINDCTINDYSLLFLDRKGSWSAFPFTLRSKVSGAIERQMYNKEVGTFSSLATYDKGRTVSHVGLVKSLMLQTNWLSDEESVYFEELLTSGWVYLKDGTKYFAVTIEENGFDVERLKNKHLIRKVVNVKFAVDTPINV